MCVYMKPSCKFFATIHFIHNNSSRSRTARAGHAVRYVSVVVYLWSFFRVMEARSYLRLNDTVSVTVLWCCCGHVGDVDYVGCTSTEQFSRTEIGSSEHLACSCRVSVAAILRRSSIRRRRGCRSRGRYRRDPGQLGHPKGSSSVVWGFVYVWMTITNVFPSPLATQRQSREKPIWKISGSVRRWWDWCVVCVNVITCTLWTAIERTDKLNKK